MRICAIYFSDYLLSLAILPFLHRIGWWVSWLIGVAFMVNGPVLILVGVNIGLVLVHCWCCWLLFLQWWFID